MPKAALASLVSPKAPFFEGETFGFQGAAVRHLYMIAVVHALAQRRDSLRMLEIGSWTGCSALTWAEAVSAFVKEQSQLLCVDPWAPYWSSEDLASGEEVYRSMDQAASSELAYELFRHNVSFARPKLRISHLRARFAEVGGLLQREGFDLVYVDGSHYYADVLADLRAAAPLLAPGGVLCGDDLEIQYPDCPDFDYDASARRDFVPHPRKDMSFHAGVTRAVWEFFRRRVSEYAGFWCMTRTPDGWDGLRLSRTKTFIPSHFSGTYRQEAERAARELGAKR